MNNSDAALSTDNIQQDHSDIANPTARRPHVLVVEPDPAVRELCKDILGQFDVAVSIVQCAAEARTIVAARAADLVYVALAPGQEPKAEEFSRFATDLGAHVVLMSGHSKGIEIGLAAGYPFLQKPFGVRDMLRPLVLNLEVDVGDDWRPSR